MSHTHFEPGIRYDCLLEAVRIYRDAEDALSPADYIAMLQEAFFFSGSAAALYLEKNWVIAPPSVDALSLSQVPTDDLILSLESRATQTVATDGSVPPMEWEDIEQAHREIIALAHR